VSYGAGSLAITARRAGHRTIVERVRYDGISRCSRAFARGDAALVVLSQLGPGVVRGDTVSTSGRIDADAHLIVTNQAATRLMGGVRQSHSQAIWALGERAVLELVGEPLIACANARYEASTTIELSAGSFVVMSEIASVPPGAVVRLRTAVQRNGRQLFYDAFDASAAAPQTVGTFAVIGLADHRVTPLVAALDRITDDVVDARAGVGALPSGAFARLLAFDIWTVRSTLIALREAAWTALLAGQTAGCVTTAVHLSSEGGFAESSRALLVT